MKINTFPRTKTEAMEIAKEYISNPDGLAYDMDMSVEEAKELAEIVCEHRILTVKCDGDAPLKLYIRLKSNYKLVTSKPYRITVKRK